MNKNADSVKNIITTHSNSFIQGHRFFEASKQEDFSNNTFAITDTRKGRTVTGEPPENGRLTSVAQSDARPNGDQVVAGLIPALFGNILS